MFTITTTRQPVRYASPIIVTILALHSASTKPSSRYASTKPCHAMPQQNHRHAMPHKTIVTLCLNKTISFTMPQQDHHCYNAVTRPSLRCVSTKTIIALCRNKTIIALCFNKDHPCAEPQQNHHCAMLQDHCCIVPHPHRATVKYALVQLCKLISEQTRHYPSFASYALLQLCKPMSELTMHYSSFANR